MKNNNFKHFIFGYIFGSAQMILLQIAGKVEIPPWVYVPIISIVGGIILYLLYKEDVAF